MSSAIGCLLCSLAHTSKKLLIPLFSIFVLLLSLNGFAANGADNLGRIDYDFDDDGLIEINDLADLDEIRNNLDGKTLYGSNAGCPNAEDGTVNGGCIGFELTADLDFDTNANGEIDAEDDYRNITQEGIAEGWEPIGTETVIFNAIFNGNGHVIKNLTIDRPATDYVGLFGNVQDARIENFIIVNGSIVGLDRVGALVGSVTSNSQVLNIAITANVQGEERVGGLAGYIGPVTDIENAFVSGLVSGYRNIGGLVGLYGYVAGNNSNNSISKSLSTSIVSADSSVGGLVGSSSNLVVINSYWAKDLSTQADSDRSSEANSYVGVNLATLQCATTANTDSSTGCVSVDGSDEGLNAAMVLYKGWDLEIWDFGIAPNAGQQLPGLKFGDRIVRDSDGDGAFDEDDVWPNNRAASQDLDADGYPDIWSLSCDASCIEASGLELDGFPQLAGAWLDADHDGLVDEVNAACAVDCAIPLELMDSSLGDYDNDGDSDVVDADVYGVPKVDVNGNGLIDIDSLVKLNAMRYQVQGIGLQLEEGSEMVVLGCPFIIHQGIYQQRCSGYELMTDLDFDTNPNGKFDSEDLYWNENTEGAVEGWEPIGKNSGNHFSAHFNGNGHVIKNLTINRPEKYYVGLFGYVKDAKIENLAIGGLHSFIVGKRRVGTLAGFASNTQISNISVGANVQGDYYVAGLVGAIESSTHIENSFSSGSVSGNYYIAGLVGWPNESNLTPKTSISQSLSVSTVISPIGSFYDRSGGLVGRVDYTTDIINSYWAKDISGQRYSAGSSESNSYVGLNLTTLQCATAENTDSTSGCVSVDGGDEGLDAPVVLYKDWDSSIWDFGKASNASQQLPGLKFGDRIIRDGDGDGILDDDDAWPNNYAAFLDLDGDGYPDAWSPECDDACILASGLTLDQFPDHAWAALDADFDGLPDGAENCVSNCQLDGLTKDGALGDHDNDGILDLADTDSDGDGITDVDADHDGLIDIDSLDKLNAMRFQLQGIGLQLTDISDVEVSGCPFIIYQRIYQQRCSGYELTQDLDFDTNADGVIDENDDYWNENSEGVGEGWLPVGSVEEEDVFFNSHFNGNGHVIKNLNINRPEAATVVGLFGIARNSYIENVVISGPLTEVVGSDGVGALVGFSADSKILNISVAARVQGQDDVGGLVGYADNSNYKNISVSGSVSGEEFVGGLAGYFVTYVPDGDDNPNPIPSSLNNIISSSLVSGIDDVGGLVGSSDSDSDSEILIRNSYWATDTSTQLESDESSEANSYVGLTLAKLQCAIAENTDFTSGCVSEDGFDEGLEGSVILYKGWDPEVWDFGTAPNADEQLPALKINGRIFRDRDADEIFDTEDAFPLNLAAAIDNDNDGMPDFWNPRCDAQCQTDSDLVLDPFLNDTDNDGVENDFVPDKEEPVVEVPPVTEPPANPSSVAEASSGGSSGGGAMAWILLLLMTLAVVGQHRRYAKVEKE
jgi:hypothetical protein